MLSWERLPFVSKLHINSFDIKCLFFNEMMVTENEAQVFFKCPKILANLRWDPNFLPTILPVMNLKKSGISITFHVGL